MEFGSYDVDIATVNPTSDSTYTYSTTITAEKKGTTAIWATAHLNDGRTCRSIQDTDGSIVVVSSR
jgi:hypothetical protein